MMRAPRPLLRADAVELPQSLPQPHRPAACATLPLTRSRPSSGSRCGRRYPSTSASTPRAFTHQHRTRAGGAGPRTRHGGTSQSAASCRGGQRKRGCGCAVARETSGGPQAVGGGGAARAGHGGGSQVEETGGRRGVSPGKQGSALPARRGEGGG